MIRPIVLDALAVAVQEGREEPAWERLRGCDPLLRPLSSARLRSALRDAWLAVHPDDPPAHALRLAYLIAARAVPDDPSPGAVEAAFGATRHPPPSRRWWVTWSACGVALCAMAAIIAWAALAPSNPRATPAGRLLGKSLGSWVVALDRWGRDQSPETEGPLAEARAALLDGAPGAIGEAPAAALRHLVDMAEAVVGPVGRDEAQGRAGGETPRGGGGDAASGEGSGEASRPTPAPPTDAFYAAIAALDRALGEAGQPYFVDGEVLVEGGIRSIILTSFVVERERRLRSGDLSERLLHIRRLDTLNWERPHLGYTRDTLDVALVVADQVDGLVVVRVLPALAPSGAMPLASRSDRESAGWVAAVESRAGLAVREQLGRLPGLDGADAARAADLLSRRREALDRVRRELRRSGATFEDPETLALPDSLVSQLDGKAPSEDLRQLRSIDDALDDNGVRAAFAALHEAVSSSVERHEAQHRLDLALGEAFVVPEALRAATGAAETVPSWVRRSALELSAYLSELARDDRTLQVNLALAARFALDEDLWGTAESYATLVLLDALGEEAGVAREEMVPGRVVRRARVATRVIDLLELPPESVRAAAKRAWERLFARPLPALEID
ncbi:MAG: hypothetical protein AMXMBFR64_55670 [Myxococcales bacterium]